MGNWGNHFRFCKGYDYCPGLGNFELRFSGLVHSHLHGCCQPQPERDEVYDTGKACRNRLNSFDMQIMSDSEDQEDESRACRSHGMAFLRRLNSLCFRSVLFFFLSPAFFYNYSFEE